MWKPIEGFEELYKVSDNGQVQRIGSNILKPQDNSKGYLIVSLSKNGHRKSYKIHRLVLKAFVPNPDNLNITNHLDGNKKNNNVSNLEWTTSAKNNQHAWDNGLNQNTKKQREAARKTIGHARKIRLEKCQFC